MSGGALQALIVLAVAAPAAVLAALAAPRARRAALGVAPWAALPALVVSLVVPVGTSVHLEWLLLGTRLGVDASGRALLLASALLWLLAGLHAAGSLAGDPRRPRFFGFFLAAMAGNLGTVLALDAAAFYLFYALMSLAAYGLVVYRDDAPARGAGRIYIAFAMAAEMLVFVGLLGLVLAAGSGGLPLVPGATPPLWLALLLLAGFGIKAGLVVLHVSLPVAYRVLVPAAGVVIAGAMLHAGLLGWMRFLPPGGVTPPGLGAVVLGAGLAGAFYGVLVGLVQQDARALLAYSSMSQMGWMTAILGAGLLVPGAWPAALAVATVYAVHHALAKGALFLGIDAVAAARERVLVLAALAVPAVSVAGLPGTTGYLAKTGLKQALAALPGEWALLLKVLLPLGAVGTTVLMGRFLWLAWRAPAARGELPSVVGWGVLLAASLTVAWAHAANLAPGMRSFQPGAVWSALWPLLIGAMLIGWGWRGGAQPVARLVGRVPPGDLLWPALIAWRRLRDAAPVPGRVPALRLPRGLSARLPTGAGAEARLARWPVAAAVFLVLVLAVVAILARP